MSGAGRFGFLEQAVKERLPGLVPAGDFGEQGGEREIWQVQFHRFQHAHQDRAACGSAGGFAGAAGFAVEGGGAEGAFGFIVRAGRGGVLDEGEQQGGTR